MINRAIRIKNSFVVPPGLVRTFVFVLCTIIALLTSVDVRAQDEDIVGATWVTEWPEKSPALASNNEPSKLDVRSFELLPFIDSLSVEYRFSVGSSAELASMHLAIEWTGAEEGIYEGRRVRRGDMPAGIVIHTIDILMQVLIEDESVAEFFLPLDTIALGRSPSVVFVDITDVSWDRIFVDTDAEMAKRIFDDGFRLSEPKIVRAIFALKAPGYDQFADAGEEHGGDIRQDDRVEEAVFIPDVDIWIDWSTGRSYWNPPPGSVRKTGPTGREDIGRSGLSGGRGGVTRGGGRDGSGSDDDRGDSADGDDERSASANDRDDRSSGDGIDIGGILDAAGSGDDDDDEKDRLYPAALAGVAAIGGLAVLGGTVGYYGGSETPFGLMAGYVEPDGGLLLQAAINAEVFGKKKGPEYMVVSVTSFYNVFKSPIQPALGLGAMITEDGSDELRWTPNVSVGLAGNFGQIIVLGAYDVTEGEFRVGMAINFRFRKRK